MAISTIIETILQTKVLKTSSLGVGFGLKGARIWLEDGRQIAVKSGAKGSNLKIEGEMLTYLKEHTRLPTPEIYHKSETCLITKWIESDGQVNEKSETHLAELLAETHKIKAPQYGFDQTTPIGPLDQDNQYQDDWLSFFKQQRLLNMAHQAHERGQLPGSYLNRLEKFADQLNNYLIKPDHPSLLHGDLWGGNLLVKDGRVKAVIDPAIYYGAREIELAFMTMFHTVGQRFFDAYESLYPLPPGFHETRKDIYLLYPTLVHVALFGAGYLPPIDRCLKQYSF